MDMKKIYLIPNTEVINVQMPLSLLAAISTTGVDSENEDDPNKGNQPPGTDTGGGGGGMSKEQELWGNGGVNVWED